MGRPKAKPKTKVSNKTLKMTTIEYFNWAIKNDPGYFGFEPIKKIEPVPADLDRDNLTTRDIFLYGLWYFDKDYNRLTEKEYQELVNPEELDRELQEDEELKYE